MVTPTQDFRRDGGCRRPIAEWRAPGELGILDCVRMEAGLEEMRLPPQHVRRSDLSGIVVGEEDPQVTDDTLVLVSCLRQRLSLRLPSGEQEIERDGPSRWRRPGLGNSRRHGRPVEVALRPFLQNETGALGGGCDSLLEFAPAFVVDVEIARDQHGLGVPPTPALHLPDRQPVIDLLARSVKRYRPFGLPQTVVKARSPEGLAARVFFMKVEPVAVNPDGAFVGLALRQRGGSRRLPSAIRSRPVSQREASWLPPDPSS
ncbi:MAG: hypothetical protein JWM36_862 [Hyphomicrobiales bacterium]|nr:hypothetical protein [Hyphomicrobiales bacterium]